MAKLDTFVKIDVNGQAAVAELGQIEKAAKDVDSQVESIGGDGMAELSGSTDALMGKVGALAGPAGVGAVGAALFAAADQAANVAIEAGTMSEALGISVEEASKINAAFSDVGLEMGDTVDIALQIGSAVEDDAALAETLGLKVGEAVTPVAALKAGIDRWDFLTPTQRAKAFGEEGVRQISRLIAEGKTLDEILASVEGTRVMTEDDVNQAIAFKETVADVMGLWQSMVITVGQEVMGAVEDLRSTLAFLPGDVGSADLAFETLATTIGLVFNPIGTVIDKVKELRGESDDAATAVGDRVVAAFENAGAAAETMGNTAVGAIEEIVTEYDILVGKINAETAWLNLQDRFADVERKAQEAWDATKTGAADAETKQRAYERAVNDTAVAVGEYALEVENLPEEVVTDLVAKVQAGELDAARLELSKPVVVELIPNLKRLSDVKIPFYVAAPTSGQTSASNVTINATRTMSGREIAQVATEWSRING
jgi:hypothetical protein